MYFNNAGIGSVTVYYGIASHFASFLCMLCVPTVECVTLHDYSSDSYGHVTKCHSDKLFRYTVICYIMLVDVTMGCNVQNCC